MQVHEHRLLGIYEILSDTATHVNKIPNDCNSITHPLKHSFDNDVC